MTDNTYKITELVGSSQDSIDDAVRKGVARAAKSVHNMKWFEVTEIRGHIEGDRVGHWQVSMKIGFTVDD